MLKIIIERAGVGHPAHAPGRDPVRAHHLENHHRTLQVLRQVRRGLPLQRHHRRREEKIFNGKHWTEKRVEKIHRKIEKPGIRPERLQLEWISAAEGVRFAGVTTFRKRRNHLF
jgi:hypothetical protein